LNATNATLTLTGVQPVNAGNYSVSITNAYGSTNSAVASLTILTAAPFITAQPTSLFIQAGGSAAFTVKVNGTAPLSYQWSCNASNLPNATNATLNLTGVQTNQAGTYAVAISNPYGATNSAGATLSVAPSANVGYVIFANGAATITKISTNSAVGGAMTGFTSTNGGKYLYALLASATATTVNGHTNAILGNTGGDYAFNDGAWTLVAYGASSFLAGRMASTTALSNGQTPVNGFAGGTTAQFVVIGWLASIGPNLAAVQAWYNNGSPSSDGWIGESAVSGAIQLSDGGIIPPSILFGPPPNLISGFTLGLVAGAVNGHTSYALTIPPPLMLQAAVSGQNLKLSWPVAAGSYGVQSASSLTGPWNDAGLSVSDDGTTATATAPVTGGQPQFFRLVAQ